MRHRTILRLRRESAVTMAAALLIWLILFTPRIDGEPVVTGLATAAMLAPMVVAALFYGSESRRLARSARRPRAALPLRLCRAACAALPVAAAADLVWRSGRLDAVAVAVSAVVAATGALSYVGYFHRRLARTGAGRYRLARTSMHWALSARGRRP